MTESDNILLQLVRASMGVPYEHVNLAGVSGAQWKEVMDMASVQAVDAISMDGYHLMMKDGGGFGSLLETDEELNDLKLEWCGSVIDAEGDARCQKKAIASLAGELESECPGIRMMVLKGYGLSRYYSVPEHRSSGDIDVYLSFGSSEGKGGGRPAWRAGDDVIRRKGITVDESHEHHTTFKWCGMPVENHYDFINVRAHRDAGMIEERLKELAARGYEKVGVDPDGAEILVPSADFNVIFLIRHLGQHFAADRVTLKQLMDWGLFLDHEGRNIDWGQAVPFLKEMGIWTFFNQINAICRDSLGLPLGDIPEIERNEDLERRILEDILHPEFYGTQPAGGPGVLIFKARRWWYNRWKHPLVYAERLLPMLITLAFSHLERRIINLRNR